MRDRVLDLLLARQGHFLFESGHHGDRWLDLELLCLRPQLIRPLAAELAGRLRGFNIDIVCGPLVEGAFVGLLVASELGAGFAYSERFFRSEQNGLFPAGYLIPYSLRSSVRHRRVAIVNDVINAGSAVRGTFEALLECEAKVVAIGSLLALGSSASDFASSKSVVLEAITTLPNNLWKPLECPLCAASVPLEDIGEFNVARGRVANHSSHSF